MRPTVLSAVAILLAATASTAQPPLTQEFDEASYLDVRRTSKQTIRVAGRAKETEMTIRLLMKLQPSKVTRAGTTLEVTVLACEDVSVTKGEPDEKETFKGLKSQKFRVTVAAANRGFEIATTKELVEAVFGDEAKNGTDAEKKFASDTVEALLRSHLLDAFMPLPEKAVAVGDKWKNTAEFALQPIARVVFEREYVFAGQQVHDGRRVDVVNWASRMDVKPLAGDDDLFPFKVKELKPVGKPQNEGTVLWDREAKRPLRVDSLQTYELALVIDIDGKQVKGSGGGTETFVLRYLTKNPDAK